MSQTYVKRRQVNLIILPNLRLVHITEVLSINGTYKLGEVLRKWIFRYARHYLFILLEANERQSGKIMRNAFHPVKRLHQTKVFFFFVYEIICVRSGAKYINALVVIMHLI